MNLWFRSFNLCLKQRFQMFITLYLLVYEISGHQTIYPSCTEPFTSLTVSFFMWEGPWIQDNLRKKRKKVKEAHAERDDVIPIPHWTTPTFIKHSRSPQSDSTPLDVLEDSEKDHLCPVKVNIKINILYKNIPFNYSSAERLEGCATQIPQK